MPFKHKAKPPTRPARNVPDLCYTLRMAGADAGRRLTGTLLLSDKVMQHPNGDVAIGDLFALYLGMGLDKQKIRLDFKANLRYRDLKLRPEREGVIRGLCTSMRLPLPLDMDRTLRTCKWEWVEKGVLEITLPFEVADPDEDEADNEVEDSSDEFDDWASDDD